MKERNVNVGHFIVFIYDENQYNCDHIQKLIANGTLLYHFSNQLLLLSNIDM